MQLETQYEIGQQVFIPELKIKARVMSFFYDGTGLQYRCRWFNGMDPKTEYFFESEISFVPQEETPGFANGGEK